MSRSVYTFATNSYFVEAIQCSRINIYIYMDATTKRVQTRLVSGAVNYLKTSEDMWKHNTGWSPITREGAFTRKCMKDFGFKLLYWK